MRVGEKIREARLARGLTQSVLGQPDLSKAAISQIESGRTMPTVRTLELLAERLRSPLSHFLRGTTPLLARRSLRILLARGGDQMRQRKFKAALATFSQAREIAESYASRFSDQVTLAMLGVGEASLALRELSGAEQALTDARQRARRHRDRLTEARALHALGTVQHRRGQFAEAIELHRAALNLMPKFAPRAFRGEVWVYLGAVLLRAGRLQESWEANTRARVIFERAGLKDRLGGTLMNLGLVRYGQGRFDEAILLYEQALLHLETVEDIGRVARVRNNLGMALLALGRPRDALRHLTTSLAMARRLGDAALECWVLTEVARGHAVAGQTDRAHEYAQLALDRSHTVGLADEAIRSQIVLGGLALRRGDTAQARRYFKLATDAAEPKAMMQELVAGRLGLARTAMVSGRHKEATAYFDRLFVDLERVAHDDAKSAIRAADQIIPRVSTPYTTAE
jgi:tetratricopeptide (TPR) repeat protein